MYSFIGNELIFTWEEGGIKENFHEVITALQTAAARSLDIRDIIRIRFPNMAERGLLETRPTMMAQLPPVIPGVSAYSLLSTMPYLLVTCEYISIFYALEIPGMCQLLDSGVLAVSPDFASELPSIVSLTFNLAVSQLIYGTLTPMTQEYSNIRRTISVLTKKPKITKPIDFAPIYTALFGEKIATVIMKEIK